MKKMAKMCSKLKMFSIFQTLMIDLDVTLDDYRWEIALKTAIMSVVNALISCGPGQVRPSNVL